MKSLEPQICDKANIMKERNRWRFECATPGATFRSKQAPNIEAQEFEGDDLALSDDTLLFS